MKLKCPHCGAVINVNQDYFYHAGFSNQGFMYCDRDSTILLFSLYDATYESIIPDNPPWSLDSEEREKVEERVRKCPCGGTFRFSNPPLCPFCKKSIQELLPSPIYFVIINQVLDGDKENIWK